MKYFSAEPIQLIRYEKVYTTSIKPKLEAIDFFLKETKAPFHIYEVAKILEIEISELKSLMTLYHIDFLDTISFFTIVTNGSSDICKLISRQWRYAYSNTYTPEIISEIYGLDLHKVCLAFDDLGVKQITDSELTEIFRRIHVMVLK